MDQCPRSPDLLSLDFFIGIFEKRCIFKNPQQGRIWSDITLVCRSIPRNVLLSTADSFER